MKKNLAWKLQNLIDISAYCHQIDVKAITYLRHKREIKRIITMYVIAL